MRIRLALLLLLLALPAGVTAQQPVTGSLAKNGSLTISPSNQGTATVSAAGTWSGTLNFEVSNGGPVSPVACSAPDASETGVTSAAVAGTWVCPVAGFNQFIVRMSGYVSGAANLVLMVGPGGGASTSSGGGSGTGDFTNAVYNASFGTVGAPDSQVSTVQGITNGTPVATSGSLSNNAAAPGATNAGALTAVATAAAPTYVEGRMVTLSTDLAGALRTSGGGGGGGGVTANDDGSIPGATDNTNANALMSLWNGSAWARLTFGQAVMTASVPVVIASNQSAIPISGALTDATYNAAFGVAGTPDTQVASVQGVAGGDPVAMDLDTCGGVPCITETTGSVDLHTAATANGNGTSLDVTARGGLMATVTIAGTSATITWNARQDATNYRNVWARQMNVSNPTYAQTVSTVGTTYWLMDVTGSASFRAPITNCTACTVTVTVTAVISPVTQIVSALSSPIGGADPIPFASAGTTEDEHVVCTGPCTIYGLMATNHAAAPAFLRCNDDTAANTAPGSETLRLGDGTGGTLVWTHAVPGDASGRGVSFNLSVGARFATAATCWVVTGEAVTDATEVAANDVQITWMRKQ